MSGDDTEESDAVSDLPSARMLSWARNSTIYRLSRGMLTEKQLRDGIRRKAVEKFEGVTAAALNALADAAVLFATENKALDDQAYAEISTRSAVRSGKSRRSIAQKLALKGVARESVIEAVKSTDDLFAAVVYARKRRLGPFRRDEADQPLLAREMASFARQGFGYDIGRRVLSMTMETAEAIVRDGPQQAE